MAAAVRSLLLGGKGHKNDVLVPKAGTEQPRHFQQHRHTRSIVIGSGGTGKTVIDFNGTGIVVSH